MSRFKKQVSFVRCDNCGAEAEGFEPMGWISWATDGWETTRDGTVTACKHNCPRCRQHGEERQMMGDPPG